MTETPILDSPVYAHGFVTGRYLTAVADGPDVDRLMDFTPAKGKVIFTPETVIRRHEGPVPALVVQRPVTCALDDQGYLTSPGGGRGVGLIAGIYKVRFDVQDAQVPGPTRIEVKDTHTEDAPLDLVLAMPDVVPPGSVVVVDETTAQRANRSAREASAAADRAEDASTQAETSATTAGDAATRADDAAEQADAAATLSQQSALSVMPMLSGSVTITPQGGALAVDLGHAVNVVTGLDGASGAVDVIFPPVTTPDGRVDPDGLGTLLRVDAGAERLTWPGGTIVHGRPPANASAFASLVRVAGVVHVIWSVVDATPPPTADSGTGAVQATLEDVLGGRVQLMPGGTVVSSALNPGGSRWRFTNLAHVPSTYLTLTDGAMTNEYVGAGHGQCWIFQGPGGARLVELSLFTGNMDLQPEEGSGWLIASISQGASEEASEYFRSLYEAIPGAIYTYENPRDWATPRIIVMPYRADAPGWDAPSDGYVGYRVTRPMDPFRETMTISLIRPLSPDEIDALGISFPFRYMTPAEMAPYLDGGAWG